MSSRPVDGAHLRYSGLPDKPASAVRVCPAQKSTNCGRTRTLSPRCPWNDYCCKRKPGHVRRPMREVPATQRSSVSTGPVERGSIRTGSGADVIARALIDNLRYLQAKLPQHATRNDWYMALAYTVRDRMLDRYIATLDAIADGAERRQGRRVPVGRVPDRPASRQRARSISASGTQPNRRSPARTGSRRPPRAGRGARAWATAAWAVWPPATWIRWRRSTCRRSVTASATSSASSIRRFVTAGRWRSPTSGSDSATPGRSCGRKSRST